MERRRSQRLDLEVSAILLLLPLPQPIKLLGHGRFVRHAETIVLKRRRFANLCPIGTGQLSAGLQDKV